MNAVRNRTRLATENLEERLVLTNCIDFEDLGLGQVYNVGDTFTADNTGFAADIRGRDFRFSNGTPFSGGAAIVDNAQMAGDTGQDIAVNNILLDFSFQQPVPDGLTMDFGEFGGNLNLMINGDFRNFLDFQNVNGLNVGGTLVTVVNGFGNDNGVLTVDGQVNSFAVGGQELWIDHLCLRQGQGDGLDWGDAPDFPNGPFYNTVAANNGARHLIDNVHFLGQQIDQEPDGQPDFPALGDDVAGVDDEDGIRFLTPIVPGMDARVEVTANEDGFLSAWMDFNRNGAWDPSDQIFSVEFVPIGTHVLTFPVPAGAEQGSTYSRWRFTDQQLVIGPAGTGTTLPEPLAGEVEDYRNVIDNPDCIDFEELVLGATYFVGDTFTADSTGFSATFKGEPFTFVGGGMTSGGFARVDNAGMAGDVGQDLFVNNILLNADFGGTIPGLTMEFGEFGGDLNIEINGDFLVFNNFQDINGAVIGGTLVTVPVGGFGNDQGTLVVDGPINSFKIGGQEFWIDHICLRDGQGDGLDWGDAPDFPNGPFYNTVAANNGARHFIDNVHFLGDRVDREADGQPTAGADGDDLAGPASDDEDGVQLLTPMIPGQATRVRVDASADGFLSAWVDFQRNGVWDPGDQIFTVLFLPAGPNILSFNVPAGATSGDTYTRWRFTSQQVVLTPDGPGSAAGVVDGEVEDYRERILTDTDFDDDGDCDCDDVDALVAQIVSGVYDPAKDLNGDGTVDIDDLGVWLNDAALKNGLPSAYLPADANLDGVVDVSDFGIWNANKFTFGNGFCGGDFNADGGTDVSDFNIWNTFKFQSSFVLATPTWDQPQTARSEARSVQLIDAVAAQQDAWNLLPVGWETRDTWQRLIVQDAAADETVSDVPLWAENVDALFGAF